MKTCNVENCGRIHAARGVCDKHYYHLMKQDGIKKRKMAPRGHGNLRSDGYRRISVGKHPNANNYGTMFEHRYIMSKKLGRPLYPDETVHHKNGDMLDNRPTNLELCTGNHPHGQRVVDLLKWAREIIKRYENTDL